jgi:glycosyltransferase involved in cell wall biosynthesis
MPIPRQFTLVTHVVRRGDGQGRVNLEIVRRALEKGWNISIVATEVAEDVKRNARVRWLEVPVHGIPSDLLRHQVFAFRSARILAKHRRGPLLANGWITYPAADVNACHFVHSSWIRSESHPGKLLGGWKGLYQSFFTKLNAKLEIGAYNRSARVVAVSRQVERELRESGVRTELLQTIPNGVDCDEFRPGTSMREEFGLPAGVTLGLFAGDIRSPRKNLDAVLRSLVHVPEVHLAVAGGIQGSPYPAISRDLGVSDRVHFLGMVSRMPDLMRSCDLFLFPSRYEACSLVMLEAMASGLPVVTPATTGGAELVPSDGGFHLSSPEDLDGMVQFLKRTQDAPGILAEMSVRAREAAESLSWNVMADRYLDLLEGIPSAQLRPASAS